MIKNKYWPDKNTFLHLRLPFSYFLLPVFLFALSQADHIHIYNTVIVFIALHFFIYPGSNIYNSYMDKDEGSIGLLKKPPPVTRKLYYTSMIFDAAGLLLCTLAGWELTLLMLFYTGISKAYSWHGIRLKKYPVAGWLTVILFQGAYTYLMVNMSAENNFSLSWLTAKNEVAMLFTSLLIGGYYPLTQIYQHDEDSKRGDVTISYRLGITGTFIFTAILFSIACFISWIYFNNYYYLLYFRIFIISLLPVIIYFVYWFSKCINDNTKANYNHAMTMTFISSTCLIVCFSIMLYLNHFVP